jgi:cobalt/nickel transport system permease protein
MPENDELKRMRTSMAVRGFAPKANWNTMTTYGNFIGTLLVRSFERTERIYKAMLSKGYEGEFYTMVEFKANNGDWIKLAAIITLGLLMVGSEYWIGFHQAQHAWY